MSRDLAATACLRFLSTLLFVAVYVDALIISTSQVTSCLLTDANSNNELSDCARKLTMQLALTDGTSTKFLVSTYLDGQGNKKNLGSELLIQVSKTPVTVSREQRNDGARPASPCVSSSHQDDRDQSPKTRSPVRPTQYYT